MVCRGMISVQWLCKSKPTDESSVNHKTLFPPFFFNLVWLVQSNDAFSPKMAETNDFAVASNECVCCFVMDRILRQNLQLDIMLRLD